MGPHSDEPLTPAGRLFLQPETAQIINCALGVLRPIDPAAIKAGMKDAVLLRHPRFSSLLVRNRNGVECWRKTQVDLDRHLIIVAGEDPGDRFSAAESEAAVNDYMADLAVSTPLPTDKPLWEIHLLMAHRCLIFRIHHALGDGISLMSVLLASCRRAEDPGALPSIVSLKRRGGGETGRRRGWGAEEAWWFVKTVWFSVVFLVEFVVRCLWVCDRKTPISGGDGVELWPRKLATAKFSLEDMKVVKRAVPAAIAHPIFENKTDERSIRSSSNRPHQSQINYSITINDVLFGVISYGLAKYLDQRSPDTEDGVQLTGMAMVNLREQPEYKDLSDMIKSNTAAKLGNKFGAILLPIRYQRHVDPLEHLKRAKAMIDRKKHSLEALFSYKIGDLIMATLGAKYASLLNYRVVCNTSFSISNVVGPQENILLVGNPVVYLRTTASSLSHAITMHMVSYAGKADMQILVARDIIPDSEFLANCFEEALLEMKQAAVATTKMM